MLNKLFGSLDNFDTEKLMEVVNLIWNNRDKMMNLLESLPQMLQETGDSIESAGQSAVNASLFLTGNNVQEGEKGMSAGQISELAAAALERCYTEMVSTAQMIEKMGEELDEIRIPSVEPKYINVMGMKVVGGLDFGESQLLDNVANRLKDGSTKLEGIGGDLKNVASHLRNLGGALTDTGNDLNNVGARLMQSGGTLRSLGHFELPVGSKKDKEEEKPATKSGWQSKESNWGGQDI